MMDVSTRQVGQAVFLLGMLGWGFGISYAEAGADERANALFLGGAAVMVVGIYVIRRSRSAGKKS